MSPEIKLTLLIKIGYLVTAGSVPSISTTMLILVAGKILSWGNPPVRSITFSIIYPDIIYQGHTQELVKGGSL